MSFKKMKSNIGSIGFGLGFGFGFWFGQWIYKVNRKEIAKNESFCIFIFYFYFLCRHVWWKKKKH